MRSSRTRLAHRAVRIGGLAAIAVVLAGCQSDFRLDSVLPPDPATTQGEATRTIFNIIYVIGAAIFLLVEGLILFAVFRYRRRKGDTELPPQIHGNNRLEIIWTAIPIAIVLALFVVSWQTLNTVDARSDKPALKVGVIAYQWQWQFVYAGPGVDRWENCTLPENAGKCVTVFGVGPPNGNQNDPTWQRPQLHVPVNETVELQMHSQDVIHSFYVPAFLYQRDITPAKDQVIQFTADRVGTYRGQCSQFCGTGHQGMEFDVVVETPEQLQQWLASQLTPGPSPAASPAASPATSPTASPAAGVLGPAPAQ